MPPVNVLRLEDLLPVKIKTLNYLNLHGISNGNYLSSSAQLKSLKLVNQKMFHRFPDGVEIFDPRMQTVYCLNLETFSECVFRRGIFEYLSLTWKVHLPPTQLEYLVNKDLEMGLYAWKGDLMDELLKKVKLSKDIPAALSSTLTLIDNVDYCRYLKLQRILSQLKSYLDFVMDTEYIDGPTQRSLVLEIVKVFTVRNDVYKQFISNCPIKLYFLLTDAQMARFPLWNLWSDVDQDYDEATNVCLTLNAMSNFSFLLQFAVKNRYSENSFKVLRLCLSHEMGSIFDDVDSSLFLERAFEDAHFRRTKFRVVQVIYLYICHIKNQERQNTVEALKWLWGTITDRLLVEDDFMQITAPEELRYRELRETLFKCWSWYNKHVNGRNCNKTEPRSLMHLSRCVTRCRLAQCFNLPFGIGMLDLPRELIQYIQHVNKSIDCQ